MAVEKMKYVNLVGHKEYLDEFIQCHERSLKLAEGVLEQLNEEEAGQAVVMLRHLADCFQAVMDARKLHDKR